MIQVIAANEDLGARVAGGKPVVVQCAGFRCLAYEDVQGNWRSFFQGEVLAGAIKADDAEPVF